MINLSIKYPSVCEKEYQYILDIIFNEFLGIAYTAAAYDGSVCRITINDGSGQINISSDFFLKAENCWLQQSSLPESPIKKLSKDELSFNSNFFDEDIPVLYGSNEIRFLENEIFIDFDVLGCCFFLLTRYEEAVYKERDIHDRFPVEMSTAFQNDFLDRPVVNEYVELIWLCLTKLSPTIQRKYRNPEFYISCDVDFPINNVYYKFPVLVKDIIKDFLRGFNLTNVFYKCWRFVRAFTGFEIQDEYYDGIFWLMDTCEKHGHQISFYFIPIATSKHDNYVNFEDKKILKILDSIDKRGHKIGIHPGYDTSVNSYLFEESVLKFKEFILSKTSQDFSYLGGRQHYLRWDPILTAKLWSDSGFYYDSTLAYAEKAGFRCSTCYEFTMYDLIDRIKLRVKQKPLICMDVTLLGSAYENLSQDPERLLSRIKKLKERCFKYNGIFGLLWHNSNLSTDEKNIFIKALK